MAQQISIKFHDTQAGVKTFSATAGAINRFPVPADIHLELVDLATGKAPARTKVRRKGSDLVVVVEDDTAPGGQGTEIILEGYYPQIGCQLVGINEEGVYVEYMPSGSDAGKSLAMLRNGDASDVALGGTPVDITVAPVACAAPFGAAMISPAAVGAMSPWLAGALGLGAVAAVAGSRDDGNDNGGGGVALPATSAAAPSAYTDNAGPTQNPDSTAALTDDNTPGLRIAALPAGATGAVLYVDGVPVPATYDPVSGTLTPDTPLPDGMHTLGYGWRNPAGATPSSPIITVTIDTAAPAAPGNLQVADTDGNGKPNVSGTGEPGGKVTIRDPANRGYTTMADASGRFELEVDVPATSTGEWTATVTDSAENVSPPARVTVTDLTAPAVARIDSLRDDAGAVQGLVPGHGITDDANPTLSGTAEPGATVTVRDGNMVLGTARADAGGNWSFTPPTPLADGMHSLTAQAADTSHNSSAPSQPFIFTVDTHAPAAAMVYSLTDNVGPIQGRIVNGTITDDATPILTGKSEPGCTVTVRDNTAVLGTVLADASGYWTFTPPTPLADGAHSLTATVTDAAGLSSTATVPVDFTVDTQGPAAAPQITAVTDDQGAVTGAIAGGGGTDDACPAFSGAAGAGTTVVIRDGTVQIGTAAVDAAGNWTFTPALPLLNGPHSITATAMDGPGNMGPASLPFDFTVLASGVPTAPAITNVIDDAGGVANIAPGGLTNDASPTVRGTAPAGSVVTLLDGASQVLGTAAADASGHWSITPAQPLGDGTHTLTASATGPDGVSPATGGYTIIVDTAAPAAPGSLTLTDNAGPQTGSVTGGSVIDDGTPTYAGTAEPGSMVTVRDGGTVLGTVLADPGGHWTFTPATPLPDGPHVFTATVTDAAGNVSPPGPATSFRVDTAGVQVAIHAAMDDTGSITGPLAEGAQTDDARPTFSGKATPGGQVTLYRAGGAFLGTTLADADGNWSITPASDLDPGQHSLTATVTTAAAGQSGPTAAFIITVDTVVPPTPAITGATDDVGSIQGAMASGAASDDSTPALAGTAEAGSTVTVRDGATILGTALADAAGNWQFTPPTPLNTGTHPVTVTATDRSGNVSQPSAVWNVAIDVTAPAAPLTAVLTDNVGADQGVIASNGVTDDTNPTFSGIAEPGSQVTVRDGNGILGTAATDAGGNWTFTPATPLGESVHSFTAQVTDLAGNAGPRGAPIVFTIAFTPPAAPALDSVADNAGPVQTPVAGHGVTDDTTPTFSGTADAGSTVTLSGNGSLLGTALADGSGNWSFTPAAPLPEGLYVIGLTATRLGIASAPGTGTTFTVDVTAPAAPAITSVADNVGTILTPVPDNGFTDDTTPVFSGTADAGSTVTLTSNGNLFGTALADAGGNWTFTPAAPLPEGLYVIGITATDRAGLTSGSGAGITFTVDLTAPAVPAVTSLTDDRGPYQGPISNGMATDDSTPVYTGTADAGSTITVRDNGNIIGTALADGAGNWSFVPAAPLADGPHSFTATATDPAGTSSAATTPIGFTVDATPPAAMALVTAMGKDAGANSADFRTNNNDAGRGVYGTLMAALDPGDVFQVTTDGGTTWLTPILSGSNWTVVDPNAHFGSWVLQTRVMDQVGNQMVYSQAVSVDTTAPDTPASVVLTGGDLVVTLTGTGAVAGNIVNVAWGDHRIGQSLTASDIASGTVSVAIPPAYLAELPQPAYSATLVDASGNNSAAPLPATQHIDTASDAGYYSQGGDTVYQLDDTSYFSNANSGIHGQDGFDTLQLTGAGQVLNLAGMSGFSNQGKLSSIERFDLAGTGDNTLQLSLNDVLNLGKTNLFIGDGKTQMMVTGDAGDTVELSVLHGNGVDPGVWAAAGVAVVASVFYNVFQHSGLAAEILVRQGVATVVI